MHCRSGARDALGRVYWWAVAFSAFACRTRTPLLRTIGFQMKRLALFCHVFALFVAAASVDTDSGLRF